MRRLSFRLRALLRRLFGGGARDAELSEEIRSFVEHDTESKIRSGMAPEDARRATLIELGGVEQVKERVREAGAGARWESIFRDIRYALRSLGHARGFSASVIGSLSLGLAATIVAFAFINGALLRPFPGVQDQDRLVEIGILESTPLPRALRTALADYPDVFRALGEGMTSLEDLASFTESEVAATLPEPRSLPAAFVSPNYFDVLGVQPEIGRTFAPEEGRAESTVAIIGHALWTREFGREASVVGRPIQVGRQTFEIIGVAPPGFAGTSQNPVEDGVEVWLPIALVDSVGDPSSSGDRFFFFDQRPGERTIRYVGRMRDGVRVDRVEAELGVIASRPGVFGDVPVERVRVDVSGLSRLGEVVDAIGIAAIILSVPLLVLVIGCVNAANLLLMRASRRGREMALRLALGASRLRLVRQLVIESLILAVGAALLALPLAWSSLQLLTAIRVPMPLDGTVVAGALVTAFLTAVGFGLVPAFQATRQHPSAVLGAAPAASGGTRSQSRGRRAMVSGQVALSLGLLAAGFQLTSALESLAEPPGTDPDRLLLASFDLAPLRFSSAESDAFYAALLDGVSRLPGVEAAGLSSRDLARGWTFDFANAVILDAGNGPVGGLPVSGSTAGGGYFKAVGLDLLEGREFVAADRREIPGVAIVTQRLASQLFDGAALGRSLHVSTGFRDAPEADLQIVGVVESPVGLSGEEVPAIFFPSPFRSPIQHGAALTLHIRSAGPAAALAPAIRDLAAQIDPQAPILKLATLDQTIRADILLQRTLARAAALLGIVALMLASVGLYGVTAYSVALRRREIAVRMALGARPDHVLAMVLRQALAVAMIGSVLGGLAAIGAGLLIQAEIFGVAGVDVATLGGSAALLALAMLLASILPARRAARMDPNAVLREE